MTTNTAARALVVEQTVRIRAPRADVFSLLASREQIARWFRASVFEPQQGGRVEILFPMEPVDYVMVGEVTTYEPPSRIAYTWDFRNAPLRAVSLVTFDLDEDGAETVVRLTHAGFLHETEAANHAKGWPHWLGRLRTVAEGGDPGPDTHAAAEARRAALAPLLQEEIALREHAERVAEMRRALPEGPEVDEDYTLANLDGSPVKLSQVFGDKDELIVYHYMWAPDDDTPCRMCTMWDDGYDGVAHHLTDRVAFAVVAKAPPEKLAPWARGRGWERVRLLSSNGTSFNADLQAEDSDGDQVPKFSVFRKNGDTVTVFYQKGAELGEGVNRGIDMMSPVWNLLDLTPSGRGEWMPRLRY